MTLVEGPNYAAVWKRKDKIVLLLGESHTLKGISWCQERKASPLLAWFHDKIIGNSSTMWDIFLEEWFDLYESKSEYKRKEVSQKQQLSAKSPVVQFRHKLLDEYDCVARLQERKSTKCPANLRVHLVDIRPVLSAALLTYLHESFIDSLYLTHSLTNELKAETYLEVASKNILKASKLFLQVMNFSETQLEKRILKQVRILEPDDAQLVQTVLGKELLQWKIYSKRIAKQTSELKKDVVNVRELTSQRPQGWIAEVHVILTRMLRFLHESIPQVLRRQTWMLDVYLLARLLKPYVTHACVIFGNEHRRSLETYLRQAHFEQVQVSSQDNSASCVELPDTL